MLCSFCVSQGSYRKFCSACGKQNESYDQANTSLGLETFHAKECSMGHPLLKSVREAFPSQPFCSHCGLLIYGDEKIRIMHFQCNFDYKTYEEESKRFLYVGYKVVVAVIEDYCGGIVQDQDSSTGASACSECVSNSPGHANDPRFSFMAAATDPTRLEIFKSAFRAEPVEPMFDNELTIISFGINKGTPHEDWGSLIQLLIAAPA